MDFQKVFDPVNHEILLYKLYNYGERGIIYQWLKNYRTDRMQFTCANSNTDKIACRVPQAAVLGPLLFSIYINNISNAIFEAKVKMFADDTNLFVTSKTLVSANMSANNNLELLNEWPVANRLSVNINKNLLHRLPSRC